jgi:hypothetical protein
MCDIAWSKIGFNLLWLNLFALLSVNKIRVKSLRSLVTCWVSLVWKSWTLGTIYHTLSLLLGFRVLIKSCKHIGQILSRIIFWELSRFNWFLRRMYLLVTFFRWLNIRPNIILKHLFKFKIVVLILAQILNFLQNLYSLIRRRDIHRTSTFLVRFSLPSIKIHVTEIAHHFSIFHACVLGLEI